MKIVFTTAPSDYDYHYATTLETFEATEYGKTDTWRKVQMDTDEYRTKYQCARYASGMHPVRSEDPRNN